MVNSCAKGKAGEREWAAWLRERLGLTDARRGRQFSGSPESPDVVGGIPGTHAEVKRVEALNLAAAVAQAVRDAGPDAVPYVAHRRNRADWLVTVRAADLAEFARRIVERPQPTAREIEDAEMLAKGMVPDRRGGYRQLGVYEG